MSMPREISGSSFLGTSVGFARRIHRVPEGRVGRFGWFWHSVQRNRFCKTCCVNACSLKL